jgi:hypothetical protein
MEPLFSASLLLSFGQLGVGFGSQFLWPPRIYWKNKFHSTTNQNSVPFVKTLLPNVVVFTILQLGRGFDGQS